MGIFQSSPLRIEVVDLEEGIYKLTYHRDMFDVFTYIGGLKGQIPHGKGHISHIRRFTESYQCNVEFHYGVIQGTVKIDYSNGSTYQGEACLSDYEILRHGKGVYTQASGNQQDGTFSNNKFTGFGSCLYNEHLYEGEFAHGLEHGIGVNTDLSLTPQINYEFDIYVNGQPMGLTEPLDEETYQSMFSKPMNPEILARWKEYADAKKEQNEKFAGINDFISSHE